MSPSTFALGQLEEGIAQLLATLSVATLKTLDSHSVEDRGVRDQIIASIEELASTSPFFQAILAEWKPEPKV